MSNPGQLGTVIRFGDMPTPVVVPHRATTSSTRGMEQIASDVDVSLATSQSLAMVPFESPEMRHLRQQAVWWRVENNLKRMRLDRSPFVPGSFEEYVEHMNGLKTDGVLEEIYPAEREHLAPIIFNEALVRHCGTAHMFENGIVHIRCRESRDATVFSRNWRPSFAHPEAPWPTVQELKEDGDERHTSGFGRFLPIPRIPTHNRANWKSNEYVKPMPLDTFYPVPKKYLEFYFPDDHEQHEPERDEDGVYIDNCMESGRVSYVGEPAPSEVAATVRDVAWESQYFGLNRHLRTSGAVPDHIPSRPIPRASYMETMLEEFLGTPVQTSQTASRTISRNRGVTISQPGSSQNRSFDSNSAYRRLSLDSVIGSIGNISAPTKPMPSTPPSCAPGVGMTPKRSVAPHYPYVLSSPLDAAKRDFHTPTASHLEEHDQSQASGSRDAMDPREDGPWRQVSYGRGSLSKKIAIKEESSETASDTSFRPYRGEIVTQTSPRATMSFGPIERPKITHNRQTSGQISPKSPAYLPENYGKLPKMQPKASSAQDRYPLIDSGRKGKMWMENKTELSDGKQNRTKNDQKTKKKQASNPFEPLSELEALEFGAFF